MHKFTYILLLALLLVIPLSSCGQGKKPAYNELRLPKVMKEVSGIEYDQMSGLIWMVNDSGNTSQVFGYDTISKDVKCIIDVKGATNTDWEDLSMGPDRQLFIGDFGNNRSKRKDLKIYAIELPPKDVCKAMAPWVLNFSLEDQKKFPPKSKKKSYDIEAFFYLEGYFYLFSRNRAKNFDGRSTLYRLEAKAGNQIAIKIGTINVCEDRRDCQITGAAISEDKTTIALLSYNKVWTITDFAPEDILSGTITKYKLAHRTQKESISFVGPKQVIIADERSGGKGRNLYWVDLDLLKAHAKAK